MTYIVHKFHEFEEDIIDKYFPELKWVQCPAYEWYDIVEGTTIENFELKFYNMMQELIVMEGVGTAEFWVNPEDCTFYSKPLSHTRNIWEYYRYVCKEMSK